MYVQICSRLLKMAMQSKSRVEVEAEVEEEDSFGPQPLNRLEVKLQHCSLHTLEQIPSHLLPHTQRCGHSLGTKRSTSAVTCSRVVRNCPPTTWCITKSARDLGTEN